MLTDAGALLSQTHQVKNIRTAALPHVRDVAFAAWNKINTGTEYQGSYIKIQQ
jgi:hypothetical protein